MPLMPLAACAMQFAHRRPLPIGRTQKRGNKSFYENNASWSVRPIASFLAFMGACFCCGACCIVSALWCMRRAVKCAAPVLDYKSDAWAISPL